MTHLLHAVDVPAAEFPRFVGILSRNGFELADVETAPSQAPHHRVVSVRTGADESGLSERELEVLAGMAEGKRNREIARALFLSEDTIKTHARKIFKKLVVSDRAAAVAEGYRRGILGGVR
ncbi:response regulator transcription factor [Amycolatopsis sp. CA-161197]|uniref:response regulator transcription factor n=1 Tax=Amycolatopsis sp. CA-161197 TaxID=3239922 RepID=UPI003D8B7211